MKIASLVATGFAYYLNNRHSSLTVSSMKSLEDKESNYCVSDDCSCDHDHDHDDTSSSSSATTTTQAKVAGSEIAFVDKLHELARIMEDDIQLVVWEQQPEQPNFIKVTTYGHIIVYRTQHALKLI